MRLFAIDCVGAGAVDSWGYIPEPNNKLNQVLVEGMVAQLRIHKTKFFTAANGKAGIITSKLWGGAWWGGGEAEKKRKYIVF